jgi:energy-coupling factor transporter ATP-binding protein EcfA2
MLAEQITLTEDQSKALSAFHNFLLDPVEQVFVLRGYSGCGKSTLVRVMLEEIPNFFRTAKLLNPMQKEYEVELTATTNKAAETLGEITGMGATTIHSFLELRVHTDFRTNTTTLTPRTQTPKEGYLLFIDEASYVDKQLLRWIFQLTKNSKIVFIGDPAQLTPVKSTSTPVFDMNYSGAALTQVVRQAEGHPIIDLSTKFRNTVNTGEFFSFSPDGQYIKYMERKDFDEAIEAEFTRSDWRYQDSKILAWTNKRVIAYNNQVNERVSGDPDFQVGDYAVCNSFCTPRKGHSIKTDQMVQITGIGPDTDVHGVTGNWMTLDHVTTAFHPKSLQARKDRIKQARIDDNFSLVAEIESEWIDLRAAYACTINKAQGSTFDRVFIDLDDIRRCNSGDQIARMLYVAVSRARHQVFLTGDLI